MRNWGEDMELCEKATPGPWVRSNYGFQVLTNDRENSICQIPSRGNMEGQVKDAQFIAEAREALPYWLNAYRELEQVAASRLSRLEQEKWELEAEAAAMRQGLEQIKADLQECFPGDAMNLKKYDYAKTLYGAADQALSSTVGKALLDRLAKAETVVTVAGDVLREIDKAETLGDADMEDESRWLDMTDVRERVVRLKQALDDLEGEGLLGERVTRKC